MLWCTGRCAFYWQEKRHQIELKLTISQALKRYSRDRHNTSKKADVFVATGLDFLMTFWLMFPWTFFDAGDGLTGS